MEDKGILFPKGSKSECLETLDFGDKGLLIEGFEYEHPEDNCIKDENGKVFFIPTSFICKFRNINPINK